MCRHHHVYYYYTAICSHFQVFPPQQCQQTIKTPQNFTQKSKFLPKNSNISLRQQKSPSSAAIIVHNQDVSPYPRFFFVFIPSDFYLFDI